MNRSIQFTLLSLATVFALNVHAEESETRTKVKAASLHIQIVDAATSTTCTSQVPDNVKKKLNADLSTCVSVVPLKVWVNSSNPEVDAPTYEASYIYGKRLPEIDLDPVTGPAKVQTENLAKVDSYLRDLGTGCYGSDVTVVQQEATIRFESSTLGMFECTASKEIKRLGNTQFGQQAVDYYSQKKTQTLEAKAASEKYIADLKAKTLEYASRKTHELADSIDKNK